MNFFLIANKAEVEKTQLFFIFVIGKKVCPWQSSLSLGVKNAAELKRKRILLFDAHETTEFRSIFSGDKK